MWHVTDVNFFLDENESMSMHKFCKKRGGGVNLLYFSLFLFSLNVRNPSLISNAKKWELKNKSPGVLSIASNKHMRAIYEIKV